MKKLGFLVFLIASLLLGACGQPTTSSKIDAYHENSEIIGDEKEVMVANTSPSIYESIDRDKNNPEPITIGKIEKEGEEIQVSEGRYMITGYEAGTVTIKDSDDAILYETALVSEGMGVSVVTLDLTEDHTIHVDGFEEAFVQPAEPPAPNEFGPGIWEVGKDIEPGQYTATGNGYGYLQLFTKDKSPQVFEVHGESVQDPIKIDLEKGQKIKIVDTGLVYLEPQPEE